MVELWYVSDRQRDMLTMLLMCLPLESKAQINVYYSGVCFTRNTAQQNVMFREINDKNLRLKELDFVQFNSSLMQIWFWSAGLNKIRITPQFFLNKFRTYFNFIKKKSWILVCLLNYNKQYVYCCLQNTPPSRRFVLQWLNYEIFGWS